MRLISVAVPVPYLDALTYNVPDHITALPPVGARVRVPVGSRVAFRNLDGRSHQMTSNPHPVHTDCPAVSVGILGPGQTRTTGVLEVERTCGFHDHDRETDETLWGRIVVGAGRDDGSGY